MSEWGSYCFDCKRFEPLEWIGLHQFIFAHKLGPVVSINSSDNERDKK